MKKIINSEQAPAPVGPYNQAIIYNGILFASGQIALHPQTGELITASIEEETRQVMSNIKAILDAAGIGFGDIVKCSVFVTDIGNFSRINAVYATYFEGVDAPARELVQVAALPKGANVEISVIAGVNG
jgi:2-iminobutanoate/2-iminopropanoate deaminase